MKVSDLNLFYDLTALLMRDVIAPLFIIKALVRLGMRS